MKSKFVYIFCFLFYACDSLDQNSLEEFQENFNYYDYVAYGWIELFNGNYDMSISYFEQAILISDVDQDGMNDYMNNSAYVGLSWALTSNANNSISDFSSNESNNYREIAMSYLCYYHDNEGNWNTEGNSQDIELINASDLIASEHYNINENLEGLTFCEQDYCCTDCFIDDKHVALIYYYAYKFSYTEDSVLAAQYFNQAISNGLNFLSSIESVDLLDKNLDYTIRNGKPENDSSFNITRNSVVALLGQLYLKNENYSNAADIVFNGNLCDDIDPVNFTVQSIIDCLGNL